MSLAACEPSMEVEDSAEALKTRAASSGKSSTGRQEPKPQPHPARSVRHRRQFADWSALYSASIFTANDATVTDSHTGLVWQKVLPASYAPTCSGMSSDGFGCNWAEAKTYCATLERIRVAASDQSGARDDHYAPQSSTRSLLDVDRDRRPLSQLRLGCRIHLRILAPVFARLQRRRSLRALNVARTLLPWRRRKPSSRQHQKSSFVGSWGTG